MANCVFEAGDQYGCWRPVQCMDGMRPASTLQHGSVDSLLLVEVPVVEHVAEADTWSLLEEP